MLIEFLLFVVNGGEDLSQTRQTSSVGSASPNQMNENDG